MRCSVADTVLSSPRVNPTADRALANVERGEDGRLMVSIGERCGDALLAAFWRLATAYYGGK